MPSSFKAPPTIRSATDADAVAFHQCLDAVARERRWLAMTVAPPLESMRSYRQMLRTGGGIDLVVVDQSAVVGWADIDRVPWDGMRHVGRLGMGLLPAYRGRGLGYNLLHSALAAAHGAGISRVELEVFASNERAVALYRRSGFVEEGRKRSARILDGVVDDLLMMAIIGDPA